MFTAFIIGALARFAVPGPDPMPAWLTVAIGLGGTGIGYGIVYASDRQSHLLGSHRELRRGGVPRPDLPALCPEAAALGKGCVPLP